MAVIVETDDVAARLKTGLPSASNGRIEVVAAVTSCTEGVDALRSSKVDLVIVDLGLSDGPAALIDAAKQRTTRTPIIGLLAPGITTFDAFELGCAAIVEPSTEPDRLLAPILAVLAGWRVMPTTSVSDIMEGRRPPSPTLQLDEWTIALWQAIVDGRSLDDIGDRLGASPRTIKRAVADLCRKVGAANRIHLAAIGGQLSVVTTPEMHLTGVSSLDATTDVLTT